MVGGYGHRFALARYNPNGTLDLSFGDEGRVITPGFAQAVAIQSDGKIVVGGTISGQHHPNPIRFALTRYNSDGSTDATFDADGTVTTAIGTGSAYLRSIAIHSDGKIVAAGYISNSQNAFALARYNPNGSLDTTFDLDGKVITAVGDPLPGRAITESIAYSLAIQPDGKVVAAGQAYTIGFGWGSALTRYNLDGSLDTSFDSDGIATTAFSNGLAIATSISIQPDGKIVAAGFSYTGTNGGSEFALARYNSNGSPDTTFDSDGMVTTAIGPRADGANSVAVQPDCKIVAAGYSYNALLTNSDLAAVRYNANGSLDATFDFDGMLTTPIDSTVGDLESFNSIAIQPNGKIIGVGGSRVDGGDSIIVRYDPSGSLDTTFDGDGIVTTLFLFFDGNALHDVAIQPDGKLVTAGAGGGGMFAVARYDTAGSRDLTFGGSGIVHEPIPAAKAVAIQIDGKIVAAGAFRDGDDVVLDYFALTRYNANGSPDLSFHNDGFVSTAVGSSDSSSVGAIALQADGKIVVAGSADGSFAVVRYGIDGLLDTSFGGDGIVTTPVGNNGIGAHASSVILQPDGKIVASGRSSEGFTVVRYDPNGSLDPTFDADGIAANFLSDIDRVHSSVLQPDGKIIVAGSRWSAFDSIDFALVRYNSNGSLDSTFGAGGLITQEVGGSDSVAHAVALQPDGKILAAGYSANRQGLLFSNDFALVRFTPDGSLDTTFGAEGVASADFENSYDQAYGMVLDSQGRAVLVGLSGEANVPAQYPNQRFAIARFLLDSKISISGRVVSPSGAGLKNSVVILMDSVGTRRRVFTSSLGYYTFDNVPSGENYNIAVQSKRFRFEMRSMLITDNLNDINFVGQE